MSTSGSYCSKEFTEFERDRKYMESQIPNGFIGKTRVSHLDGRHCTITTDKVTWFSNSGNTRWVGIEDDEGNGFWIL